MIRWITAFIDVPDARFDADAAFWCEVTGSTLSPLRGDRHQFATVVPPAGDAHLRLQRLGPEGRSEGRIHLDFHVDSVADEVARAQELGARVVEELGAEDGGDPTVVILESLARFTFCIVGHHGEHDRGPRRPEPVEHRLDVVCIDVPATAFDDEARFWSAFTGCDLATGDQFPEFAGLALRHQGLPWNLLIQRLGDDDGRPRAEAHLDVSSGDGFGAVVERHVGLGAEVVRPSTTGRSCETPAGWSTA